MLRTVHKYRTIFLAIIVLSSFALALSGFVGQFFSTQGQAVTAIQVNDREISFDEVQLERREIEQLYRSQFGNNYFNIIQALNLNLQQQAIDRSISNALLEDLASEIGFFVGDDNITDQLRSQIGVGPEAVARYRAILDQLGVSPDQFKRDLRSDLLRSQLQSLILDASTPSSREILASLQVERTAYQVDYVEFTPATYQSSVPLPSEDEIKTYYDEHQAEFEIEEKVQYRYAIFDPSHFHDLVVLAPEDIELYYIDHEHDYTLPEKRRARLVQLQVLPSTSSEGAPVLDVERQAVKSSAEELLKKAKEGIPVGELAKSSSQHKETAATSGDLGLLTREALTQKVGAKIAEEIFKAETGTISELIEDEQSFSFIQVEEIVPASVKPLDEVKSQIETILRGLEAPAYTSTEALELYDTWTSSKEPLDQLVKKSDRISNRVAVKESKGFVNASSDPEGEPLAKGLTEKVLESSDTIQQLVELPRSTILVEIVDYRPEEIDTLENVRPKIIEKLKSRRAAEQALSDAASLLAATRAASEKPSLKSAATEKKLSIASLEGLTRKELKAPFDDKNASSQLFKLSAEQSLPTDPVVLPSGSVIVFQVLSAAVPKIEEIKKDLEKSRDGEADRLGQLTAQALISQLKAKAEIDIQPSLLASESGAI